MQALLDVTLPVFALIACGWLAVRTKLLGPASAEALNGYVYWFALPALLFVFVARAPLERILYAPFLAAFGGGYLITFALVFALFSLWRRRTLAARSVYGTNAALANTGYMGIPLASFAFGDAAVLPAIMATVFVTVVGLNLAILLIELEVARGAVGGRILRDVSASLLKNPVVLPVAAAALFPLAGWPLPRSLAGFCDLLGSSAGPCALFALGMFVAGQSLRGGLAEAGVVTLFKLVAQPALTWYLAFHLFPMEPVWAATAVLVSALPMGASCFVLAQRYGVEVGPTSSATLLSTALSVVTVTLLLAWLGPGVG